MLGISETSQNPIRLELYTHEVRVLAAFQPQIRSAPNPSVGFHIYTEPPRYRLGWARIASTADCRAGPARTCRAPITGPRAGAQALRPWAGPQLSPVSADLPGSHRSDWLSGDDVSGRLGLWQRSRLAGWVWRKSCGRGESAVQRSGTAWCKARYQSCGHCFSSLWVPRR